MNYLQDDIEKVVFSFIRNRNLPILRFVCRKWNTILLNYKINITTVYHCYKYDYQELIQWLKTNNFYSNKYESIEIDYCFILGNIKKRINSIVIPNWYYFDDKSTFIEYFGPNSKHKMNDEVKNIENYITNSIIPKTIEFSTTYLDKFIKRGNILMLEEYKKYKLFTKDYVIKYIDSSDFIPYESLVWLHSHFKLNIFKNQPNKQEYYESFGEEYSKFILYTHRNNEFNEYKIPDIDLYCFLFYKVTIQNKLDSLYNNISIIKDNILLELLKDVFKYKITDSILNYLFRYCIYYSKLKCIEFILSKVSSSNIIIVNNIYCCSLTSIKYLLKEKYIIIDPLFKQKLKDDDYNFMSDYQDLWRLIKIKTFLKNYKIKN